MKGTSKPESHNPDIPGKDHQYIRWRWKWVGAITHVNTPAVKLWWLTWCYEHFEKNATDRNGLIWTLQHTSAKHLFIICYTHLINTTNWLLNHIHPNVRKYGFIRGFVPLYHVSSQSPQVSRLKKIVLTNLIHSFLSMHSHPFIFISACFIHWLGH